MFLSYGQKLTHHVWYGKPQPSFILPRSTIARIIRCEAVELVHPPRLRCRHVLQEVSEVVVAAAEELVTQGSPLAQVQQDVSLLEIPKNRRFRSGARIFGRTRIAALLCVFE